MLLKSCGVTSQNAQNENLSVQKCVFGQRYLLKMKIYLLTSAKMSDF